MRYEDAFNLPGEAKKGLTSSRGTDGKNPGRRQWRFKEERPSIKFRSSFSDLTNHLRPVNKSGQGFGS
jgi:hypothetical protein